VPQLSPYLEGGTESERARVCVCVWTRKRECVWEREREIPRRTGRSGVRVEGVESGVCRTVKYDPFIRSQLASRN